jgi:hypothetical protein
MRAGLHHPLELAETQHHAALLFGHQHEAVERQPQAQHDPDPAQRAAVACIPSK